MSDMEGSLQVTRLVTFLGLGPYNPAEYQFRKETAARTPYVCRALAELLQPSDIAVLATEEAKKLHGDALKETLLTSGFPEPRFVSIPAGSSPTEVWIQFDVIKTALRGAPSPVMLDITHGFRSQPFFAAAVTAFVHAVDDDPPDLRVCYAAYDARNQESIAPVWELTEFVKLLDWSRSLAMFLRTGRAEEAGKTTKRLGNDLKRAWFEGGMQGEQPNLKELGDALARFGADLDTLRTGDLLIGRGGSASSAASLLEVAKGVREEVARHAPPLADILDRMVAMAEPLSGAGEDLSGDKGRNAVAALADLYLRLGRNLEAVATVREGWVNLYAQKTALVPGARNFDWEERKQAEKRAHQYDRTYREVTDRRNDFAHAQYRPSGQEAAGIAQTVRTLVEKLRIAKPVEVEAALGDCFVNLSNHPSEKWDDAQTRAAHDLAKPIVDIEFPAVPPDADEKTIETLAKECVGKVPPQTTHALVQGEFTLTFELVRSLQARGVTCLAATTTRNVEEEANGRKVSSFTFVRFRAYADLGPV